MSIKTNLTLKWHFNSPVHRLITIPKETEVEKFQMGCLLALMRKLCSVTFWSTQVFLK